MNKIKAAVLGSPIAHSLSPVLHRTAYRELGIIGEYSAIEVKSGGLREFISKLDGSWTGFSLTMPLKEEVIELAAEIDETASRIASANTLLRSDSDWNATSTDVNGFKEALNAHSPLKFDHVVILGAGATARAVAAACNGFAKKISVLHRSISRESALKKSAPSVVINFLDWNCDIPSADLIVNTTPAGVADRFCNKIPARYSGAFFEALYHPWPTALLQRCREQGLLSIDGLDLLIHQGIDQVALMSQQDIDRRTLAPILRRECLSILES